MAETQTNLKKLKKDELLQVAQDMHAELLEIKADQSHLDATSSNATNKLIKKVTYLEEILDQTQDRLYRAEVAINNLDQYSRRENIEILGIPDNITINNLETTVIEILDSIGVQVSSYNIVACHRLKKKNYQKSASTIVRFVNRKSVHEIKTKKKNLNESPYKEVFGNNISITDNLSPENRFIYDSCYLLKKKNVIKNVWSFNGVVHVKYADKSDERTIKLYHTDDIFHSIPNVDKFLDDRFL